MTWWSDPTEEWLVLRGTVAQYRGIGTIRAITWRDASELARAMYGEQVTVILARNLPDLLTAVDLTEHTVDVAAFAHEARVRHDLAARRNGGQERTK